MREFDLSDWDGLSEAFSGMFEGLGEVTATDGAISYSSNPPDVATGISITSDGGIVANIPLHGKDSRFARGHIARLGVLHPPDRTEHGLHVQGAAADTRQAQGPQRTG